MRILIDADGCPVVDLTVAAAREFGLECIILCDTAHYFDKEGARTMVLAQGADSVDFALVNLVQAGDIVVTQDYGLAAMCLARKGKPIMTEILTVCWRAATQRKKCAGAEVERRDHLSVPRSRMRHLCGSCEN